MKCRLWDAPRANLGTKSLESNLVQLFNRVSTVYLEVLTSGCGTFDRLTDLRRRRLYRVEPASGQKEWRPVSNESPEREIQPRHVMGFIAALMLSFLLLPFFEAPLETSSRLTAEVAARGLTGDVAELVDESGTSAEYTGPDALEESVRSRLFTSDTQAPDTHFGVVATREAVTVAVESPGLEKPLKKRQRIGDWQSVLPPLMAVFIALFFRKLVLGLAGAVWLGATIATGWNPVTGLWKAASEYVWGSVASTFNLYIIFFTLALVGMVQVVTRSGGIAGVLDKVRALAQSARSTRIATALMGGAIFFDDYANTVVVGSTMRPLTDKRRISREKLAYLVDSTSAPIAGVAVISTWIGYEVGLFGELSEQLQLGLSGYDIFFGVLPLRFYCLMTLGFVFLIAYSGRDYGAMWKAEKRAWETGEVLRPGSKPLTSAAFSKVEPIEGAPHRWYNAVIPVTLVLIAVFAGMFWSGWSSAGSSIPGLFTWQFAAIAEGWGAALSDIGSYQAWRDAFSNADNAKVLFWASMLGSATAIALSAGQKIMTWRQATETWLSAIPAMWLAVTILILAWAIRAVCDDLGTSIYLVGAVEGFLTPELLPLVTFVLAAAVAFATGTSWGTMGILLPALIPLAFYMTEGMANAEIILFLCFGAVLDGAIFGDHCSPISDTTVMSSIAASCDHLDHVRTQFPYAMTTMALAAGFGYLGVAYGFTPWVSYLLAALAGVAIVYTLGKPHGQTPNGDSAD